jgi:hypothetical protein
MLSSLPELQHADAYHERPTHASNSTASIGRSGVDASSSVFRVANPPGFLVDQMMLVRTSMVLSHTPAPITAIRIAGPSMPDTVLWRNMRLCFFGVLLRANTAI